MESAADETRIDDLIPEQRRALIAEWLREQRALTVEELARRLNVSLMTIHRDINRLVERGVARKVRGGVVAAEKEPDSGAVNRSSCVTCGKRVPRRTAWVITTGQGEQWHACCAHCGLLWLHHTTEARAVLATDFLYGQMVNAYQAIFVLGSAVTLCCVPGVLCFASRQDAERYRLGFGGELLDFQEALAAVGRAHHAQT